LNLHLLTCSDEGRSSAAPEPEDDVEAPVIEKPRGTPDSCSGKKAHRSSNVRFSALFSVRIGPDAPDARKQGIQGKKVHYGFNSGKHQPSEPLMTAS
jgi:hypothetical protein